MDLTLAICRAMKIPVASLSKLINRLIFRRPLPEPPTRPSYQSLPNELVLHVFSFLELKPYIISHGVCMKWRRLLPLTDIHPIRKRLFDLYHYMLNTPKFIMTRPWVVENLQPFDRHAYVDSLLSQYPVLPEEFRIWVLEWPARMAIRCTWPGIPFIECCNSTPNFRSGVSWLSHRPSSPTLSALVYKRNTPSALFIPALLIWRGGVTTEWLVFEANEPGLFGRVYALNSILGHNPSRIPYMRPKNNGVDSDGESSSSEDTDDAEARPVIYMDWISYQENLWHEAAQAILEPERYYYNRNPELEVPQPVEFAFGGSDCTLLPAPMWTSRNLFTNHLVPST